MAQEGQTIADGLTAAIYEIDRSGVITSIYQADSLVMNNEDGRQFTGSLFVNYVHPDDRECVNSSLQKAWLLGRFDEVQFRSSDSNGFRKFFSTFIPLKTPDGVVTTLLGVTQDRTNQQPTDARMGLAESRLQAVIDSVFPFIWLWTVDGIVIDSNLPPLQASGLSRKDVIGQPFIETYWISHSPQVQTQFQEMLHRAGQGETVREEVKVRLGPDQFITVDTCITPLKDARGKVLELVGSGTDITKQKQSQEALQQSEARFRTLYDETPTTYLTATCDGTILSVNQFGLQQLGYTNAELVGQSLFTLFHHEDRTSAYERFQALIKNSEQPIRWEFRKVRKDGTMRAVREAVRLVQGLEQHPVVLIVSEDITEWTQAKAEKLTLQYAVDQGMEGLAIHDTQGVFTYVNPSEALMYGYEVEELLGQSWKIFYEQDQITRIEEHCWPILLKEGKWRGDLVGKKKQGGTFNVEVSLTLLKSESGHPPGLICTCRDVTARRRTEQALLESEERFDLAVRGSTDGLWDGRPLPGEPWNTPHTPVWWSPRFREMLGYDEEEFPPVLASWAAVLHPEDRDGVFAALSLHIEDKRPYDKEYQMRTKAGAYRWFRARGQAKWSKEGELLRISGSLQDITEKKHAQKELQQAYDNLLNLSRRLDVAKEEEGKRIAQELHDEFGQTLTALNVDLAWVKRKINGIPEIQHTPQLVEKLNSMSHLITEAVHNVRRMATSLRPPLLDQLGLIPALEWQAQDFQSRTGTPCELSLCSYLVGLESNTEIGPAIFRIIQELLTNVMRHAQASSVRIQFREEPPWMCLEVQDNGIGFTQDNIRTNSLGLLGIRERAMIFGGEFTIHGIEGKGTTALIRMPMKDGVLTKQEPHHG